MYRTAFVLLCCLVFQSIPVEAQWPADFSHRCIYHGAQLPAGLYPVPNGGPAMQRIEELLQSGAGLRLAGGPDETLEWPHDTAFKFEIRQANVEDVLAVADHGHYYLLYNEAYLQDLKNDALAYTLLAHAIGHLVNRHSLDDAHRIWEELEADAFAGYALYGIAGMRAEALTGLPGALRLSYPVPDSQRVAALQQGWERAEAAFRAQNDQTFWETPDPANNTPVNSRWSLPDLPWPPPCCPNTYPLGDHLQAEFRTLGDLAAHLSAALESRGYSERRYLSLPNGFALVTKMEQFDGNTGLPQNPGRWLDYPVQQRFDGLLDYLRSLLAPNRGYFRVFVFAVTNRPTNTTERPLSKAEAVAWLRNGFNRLPPEVAEQRLSARHFLDAYVYLFQASDADNRTRPCLVNCLNDCRIHLERSGILEEWERK